MLKCVRGVVMNGTKVVVSYNCNMVCDCCEYSCAPYKKGRMNVKEFQKEINYSFSLGYSDYIKIEGGEPFLKPSLLSKYLKSIIDIDSKKFIKTNGYWGNMDPFMDIIDGLKKNDLYGLIFEYDFYHSIFIDIQTIKKAISKAIKCDIDVSIKSCFNTKNLSCIEDIKTYEYIKEIKNQFKNINLIFENRPPTPKSINERLILYSKDS